MQPTGTQIRQLHQALLQAYDQAGLTRLVRVHLDTDLEQLVPTTDKNLTEITYALVRVCAAQLGGLKRLLASALADNPTNPDLSKVADAFAGLEFDVLPMPREEAATGVDGDLIKIYIGDDASNVIVGKDITVQRLDYADAHNQRNHAILRQQVRKFWIDSVLHGSLYREILIHLQMEDVSSAVDNQPWNLVLKQPGLTDQALLSGASIVDIFDEMQHRLLILGKPGSGKTTMLLTLADALLRRADDDPLHPTPVVFNLASWVEQRNPLDVWLVSELNIRYNVARKVAQRWVDNDELLPLLDGLDEVQEEHRNNCVNAINQYQQDHMVFVVVCCREAEYQGLTKPLKLQGAVLLCPLMPRQIDAYLDRAVPEVTALRSVIQRDPELYEMARSPLMLNVMTFACYDSDRQDTSPAGAIGDRYQQLLDRYVRRMFLHRGSRHQYSVHNALHWLVWLSTNMTESQQTIFLIERLQPDSLGSRPRIVLFRMMVGLFVWASVFFSTLLSALLIEKSNGLLAGHLEIKVEGLLTDGLIFGLVGGLIFGLFAGRRNITPTERLKFRWGFDRSKLKFGLIFGLMFGLIFVLSFGQRNLIDNLILRLMLGLAFGLIVGSIIGLDFGLMFGFIREEEIDVHFYPNQGIWRSGRNMLIGGLSIGLVGALAGALVGGPIGMLGSGLTGALEVGQIGELETWLFAGLIFGLIYGLIAGLILGLIAGVLMYGGLAVLQHSILRLLLFHFRNTPLNYAHFLDYCTNRIFLRKVGGGYIFIHRTLLEHFAQLSDQDIEHIAAQVVEE